MSRWVWNVHLCVQFMTMSASSLATFLWRELCALRQSLHESVWPQLPVPFDGFYSFSANSYLDALLLYCRLELYSTERLQSSRLRGEGVVLGVWEKTMSYLLLRAHSQKTLQIEKPPCLKSVDFQIKHSSIVVRRVFFQKSEKCFVSMVLHYQSLLLCQSDDVPVSL